jgi:hypothetical protein
MIFWISSRCGVGLYKPYLAGESNSKRGEKTGKDKRKYQKTVPFHRKCLNLVNFRYFCLEREIDSLVFWISSKCGVYSLSHVGLV